MFGCLVKEKTYVAVAVFRCRLLQGKELFTALSVAQAMAHT